MHGYGNLNPTENYGTATHLTTGYVWDGESEVEGEPNPLEKQSLLKFDIEYVPDGGCTLTPGYWKTHSYMDLHHMMILGHSFLMAKILHFFEVVKLIIKYYGHLLQEMHTTNYRFNTLQQS